MKKITEPEIKVIKMEKVDVICASTEGVTIKQLTTANDDESILY